MAQFDEFTGNISMVGLRTSEVTRIEREINALLTNTIDGFMYRFSETNPAFFSTHCVARAVIDRRGPTLGPKDRDDGSLAS